MPINKEISLDPIIVAADVPDTAYFPIVNPEEPVLSDRNKRILVSEAKNLFESDSGEYSALTPGATIPWDALTGRKKTVALTINGALVMTGSHKEGLLFVIHQVAGTVLTLPGEKPTVFNFSTGVGEVDLLGFTNRDGVLYWDITNYGAVVAVDTTPPTVISATAIDAATIRLILSEVGTGTNIGHSFKKNGSDLVPTAISGSGTNTFYFTVPTMLSTDTILRSYNSGTGNTIDAATNELVSYTDQPVTNAIGGGGGILGEDELGDFVLGG